MNGISVRVHTPPSLGFWPELGITIPAILPIRSSEGRTPPEAAAKRILPPDEKREIPLHAALGRSCTPGRGSSSSRWHTRNGNHTQAGPEVAVGAAALEHVQD